MAEKIGCSVESEVREDGIYLHVSRTGEPETTQAPHAAATPGTGPLVLTIPSQYMGRGDEELGHVLIRAFFHTLGEVTPLPDTVIFLNSGVKLVVEDSPVLEDIQSLRERGIEILACGTCLGHYGLKEKVAVGEVSNMYTIAETMLGAGKAISL
jgi:selenium metabolism protein YedF